MEQILGSVQAPGSRVCCFLTASENGLAEAFTGDEKDVGLIKRTKSVMKITM